MLRGLVLLLALLNVALYFWIRTDPAWTQADRDPQRLAQQVSPGAVTWVPTPASGASAPAAAASSAVQATATAASASAPGAGASATAAGAASAPGVGASRPAAAGLQASAQPASAAAATTLAGPTVAACVESAALPAAEAAALQRSLLAAGVPARAVTLQADSQAARWMVYMGRFATPAQAQRKADELHRLGLSYAPLSHPDDLAPGLSLGVFSSQANAESRLAALGRQGVHTARVLALPADGAARRVRVSPVAAAWQKAVPASRFTACGQVH